MSIFHGVAATAPVFDLAEGIIWDDRTQRALWVDIQQGRIHTARVHGNVLVETEVVHLGETCGAVALAEDGGLLIAASRGLVAISVDKVISKGPNLLSDRRDVRFNDAAVDPYGAFVLGTLCTGSAPLRSGQGEEQLLRITAAGDVEVIRDGVQLSNGVAFSPDGHTIYHVDTLASTVSSHSWADGRFSTDEPWLPLPISFPALPDGLVVDSMGSLWIALWGGSAVHRYSPTGTLLDVVRVDAAQVTCPGFIGSGNDVLAITSARTGLESATDESGAVFLANVGDSLGVRGLPTARWAGSTDRPYWLGTGGENP